MMAFLYAALEGNEASAKIVGFVAGARILELSLPASPACASAAAFLTLMTSRMRAALLPAWSPSMTNQETFGETCSKWQ